MRLLLDTHSFLWFVGGDSSLSVPARLLIEDADHSVPLSVASVWEIAIKVSLGKLHLEQPLDVLIPQQLLMNHIELLGITLQRCPGRKASVLLSRPIRPFVDCAGDR